MYKRVDLNVHFYFPRNIHNHCISSQGIFFGVITTYFNYFVFPFSDFQFVRTTRILRIKREGYIWFIIKLHLITLGNNSESIKNIIREECVSIYWKVASWFPIITTIQKKSLPIEREGYNPEKKYILDGNNSENNIIWQQKLWVIQSDDQWRS